MADFLPPVVATLLGNISDYSAKMDEAAAKAEGTDAKISAAGKASNALIAAAEIDPDSTEFDRGYLCGQRDLLEILGRNGLRVEAGPEFAASRRAPRQTGNAGDRHGT